VNQRGSVVYYDCVSIETAAFRRDSGERSALHDPFEIVSGLAACHAYFRFALADIGPYEAFGDYLLLRALARRLIEARFSPRLVTSARHFSEMEECVQQFIEMKATGVHRIVLRLDENSAERLCDQNVRNYAYACAASGFHSELRFDLEQSVPSALLRVAREIETARYYTAIYPKKRLPVTRVEYNGHPLLDIKSERFRIVVDSGGRVFLRRHEATATREIGIGDLSSSSLPNLIDPARFGASVGEVSHAAHV
jgi:hypothetical protein